MSSPWSFSDMVVLIGQQNALVIANKLETIVEQMVIIVGYEKALEIVKKFEPKEETKPEEKKPEEKKRRIPRMSPTISGHLKSVLGVEPTDEIKKGFMTYANGLTEDEYASKGLLDHIRDFANLKKSTETTTVVNTVEKPKKGRAKKKAEEKVTVVKAEEAATTVKSEETKVKPVKSKSSNAAGIVQVSLKELQDNINLVTTDYTAKGTYLDTATNEVVTGPESEDDEWVDPVHFQGKTYMVTNKSGRVYVETEGEGPDVFHGFVGVGQFATMKMPKTKA